MPLTLILFCLSAAAIYGSCEYFVNGIEWLGRHLRLSSMAVGAVLAAFGTALPECSVTFIAAVFGRSPADKDLGVGAALGGPLVLSTLAYAAVGIALLMNWRGLNRASCAVEVNSRSIGRDQGIFLAIFSANLLLGLFLFPFKQIFGLILLAAYVVYVLRKMKTRDAVEDTELEPLKIRRAHASSLGWAAAQSLLSLAVIFVASRVFVLQLGAIGAALHWPPQMAALLLSPVATELPETMNALIWVRQGKERLALANISGAMMIQATVPSAIGLLATPWRFDRTLTIGCLVTVASIAFLWLVFRRGTVDARALASVCAFYALFAALVVHDFAHRWEHVPAADHARANPFASHPEAIAAGQTTYQAHCLSCHGVQARGDGVKVPSLHNANLRQASDGDIEWFLRQGVSAEGMPSWQRLSENERWQIVAYLKSIQ